MGGGVKPFVKRTKADARDAAAICVAARRPDMRPVAIKSEEQQASRALERSRELLIKQRAQLMNSLRSMLAEFGVVATQGGRGFAELTATGLPETMVGALRLVLEQLGKLTTAIEALGDRIKAVVKADPDMRRLARIQKRRVHHRACGRSGDRRRAAVRLFALLCRLGRHNPAGEFLGRRTAGLGRQGESRLRKLFALGGTTLMRNARSRDDRGSAAFSRGGR